MWRRKNGPCTCYFCDFNKEHPEAHQKFMTEERGHLQVSESLDPKDIVRTIMCTLCTHEVKKEAQ